MQVRYAVLAALHLAGFRCGAQPSAGWPPLSRPCSVNLGAAGTLSCERRFTDEVAIATYEESVTRVRHITVSNALMRHEILGRTLLRVRRPCHPRRPAQ